MKKIIVLLLMVMLATNVFSIADAPAEAAEPAAPPAEGGPGESRAVETAPLWKNGPQVWKEDIPGYYKDWDEDKSFDKNYESVDQLDSRIKKIEGDSRGFAFNDLQYYYTRDGLRVIINEDENNFIIADNEGDSMSIPQNNAQLSRTTKGFRVTDSQGQTIATLNGKGFSFVDAQGQTSARIDVERFNEILTEDSLANNDFDKATRMAIAVANAADRAGQDLEDYEWDESNNQWNLEGAPQGTESSISVDDNLMVTLEQTTSGQPSITTWSTPEGNTVKEIKTDGEVTGYNIRGNAVDESFGGFLKANGQANYDRVNELSAFVNGLEDTNMYDIEDLSLGDEKNGVRPLLENGDQIGDITTTEEGSVLRREAEWQERIQGGNFITWVANQGSEIEQYTYVVDGRSVTVDARTNKRFDAVNLNSEQKGRVALAGQGAGISEFQNLKKKDDFVFFEQTTTPLNIFEQETWAVVTNTKSGESFLIEADSVNSENLDMQELGLEGDITSNDYDKLAENHNIDDFNGIRKMDGQGRFTDVYFKSDGVWRRTSFNYDDNSFEQSVEQAGMKITRRTNQEGETTVEVEGMDELNGEYTEDEFDDTVEAMDLSEGQEEFVEASEENQLKARRDRDRGGKPWVGFRPQWLLTAYKPMHETGNLLYGKARWYNDWIEEVDKAFAEQYLGVEYWTSEVCRSEPFKYQYPGDDVFVETPSGISQFAGHIEATVSDPVPIICSTRGYCQSKTADSDAECIGNVCRIPTGNCNSQSDCSEKEICHEGECKRERQNYFYKITWGVRAPQDSDLTPEKDGEEAVDFNIMIKSPAKTAVLFDSHISLNNGEISNNIIADYAVQKYDEICIMYGDKYPIAFRPGLHPPEVKIRHHCNQIKSTQEDWSNWETSGQDENTGSDDPNYLPGWTG